MGNDPLPLLFLAAFTVALVIVSARRELKEPTTFRAALKSCSQTWPMHLIFAACLVSGMALTVSNLMDHEESRHLDRIEFGTGMAQALERVAYLRGGSLETFREWSGASWDGSRYAILRDGAGPVVRAENLSRDACAAVLSFLSPYATSVLTMRDERGVVHLEPKGRVCPEGDARLSSVFRAPA